MPNALIFIEILCQFTAFGRETAIVLVVLRNVESNGFVGLANAHCNHLICNVIEQIGHCKCEDKDNANGNHVVENELPVSNAIGRKAFGLILIDEYARKDCADNTAHTVCREHIQGIVDAGVVFQWHAKFEIMVVIMAITMLSLTDTHPADGVMATRPSTPPTAAPIADGLRPVRQSIKIHIIIAVAAAVLVFKKALTAIPSA